MRFSPALLALAVITVALSGCMTGTGSGPTESDGLVRVIRFTFDDETIEALENVDDPDALFEAVTATFFRYTHEGPDVAAADVTASFVGASGVDVERALSSFTSASTLSDGDTVTITGAAPYSTMTLRQGDSVLAERRHVLPDWYYVDGTPLPLAAPLGSSAAWRTTGGAGVEVSFAHAGYEWEEVQPDYGCYEDCVRREPVRQGVHLDDVRFDLTAEAQGRFALAALADGSNTHLDFQLDGSFGIGSALEGVVAMFTDSPDNLSAEASGPFGYAVNASIEGDGLQRLIFDDSGTLRATGSEGRFSTSASGRSWMPGTSQDDATELVDPDDLPEGSSPYQEYPYESRYPIPGLVANLVADIYGMTLVPGDSFELVAAYGDDDVDVDMSMEVLVAAREQKTVAAGEMPTLRIETSIEFEATPQGASPNSMSIRGMTHWIHEHNYLPVLIQQQTPTDWPTDEDLQELLDGISEFAAAEGQGSNVSMPTSMRTAIQAEGTVELTSLNGNVRIPAIMSLMSMWSMWGLPFSAMLLGLENPGYGYGYGEPVYPREAPGIAFDRVGDEISVVYHDGSVYWDELTVELGGECSASLQRSGGASPIESGQPAGPADAQVSAGDAILVERVGECLVDVVHVPTETVLGSWFLDA